MKIEEVIKIYSFLGNLNIWGFISVCSLLMSGILVILIPLKEKVSISWSAITLILMISCVALTGLFIQAKKRTVLLQIGNFINQDFVWSCYKQKSFYNINFPEGYDKASKIEYLYQLQDEFPNDFLIVIVDSSAKDELLKKGIAILDSKAVAKIEKNIEAKAISTSEIIDKFMQNKSINILYTNTKKGEEYSIENDISNEGWLIGQDFFKAIVGKKGLFPIYNNKYEIIGFKKLEEFNNINNNKTDINCAVKEIIAELESMQGNYEGIIFLKRKINRPNYSNHFLQEVIKYSNGKLKSIKLIDQGNHDTTGIALVKKK